MNKVPLPPSPALPPLSSGPSAHTCRPPRHVYAQLGFEIFLSVLWLAATTSYNHVCSGVCSACVAPGDEFYGGLCDIWFGSLTCGCAYSAHNPGLNKMKRALERRRTSNTTLKASKEFESAGKIAAKLGFGALAIILFASTMAINIWFIHQIRKAFANPEGHGRTTEVPNQQDASKDGAYPQKSNGFGNSPPVSEVQ